MSLRSTAACLALTLMAAVAGSPAAQALTMQECSAKYKAAQNAGNTEGHEVERLPQGRVRLGRYRRSTGCAYEHHDSPTCSARIASRCAHR